MKYPDNYEQIHFLQILFWNKFRTWKRDVFLNYVDSGISWHEAYILTKKTKRV
jgi:hypothetical protein